MCMASHALLIPSKVAARPPMRCSRPRAGPARTPDCTKIRPRWISASRTEMRRRHDSAQKPCRFPRPLQATLEDGPGNDRRQLSFRLRRRTLVWVDGGGLAKNDALAPRGFGALNREISSGSWFCTSSSVASSHSEMGANA